MLANDRMVSPYSLSHTVNARFGMPHGLRPSVATNLVSSAVSPGIAAKQAEEWKVMRSTQHVCDRFHFVSFAIETSEVLGPSTSVIRETYRFSSRYVHIDNPSEVCIFFPAHFFGYCSW